MDLSIIIVNWNTCDLLKQCLNSIDLNSQDLDYEIWVVDNGSQDGSSEMVETHYPYVRLIKNKTNNGFVKANNQALRAAGGQFLLLLNSDTIVLPGTLEALFHTACGLPVAAAVGCKLINIDGSLQESWADFPSIWTECLGRNKRSMKLVNPDTLLYEVDWISGACILVRSEAIAQVGLMDETFFMYSEETDWCFRMKQKGWKIFYLESSAIIHLGGGSANRRSAVQLIRLYDSKIHFFKKHYGFWRTTFLRFGLIGANLWGLVRRLIKLPFEKQSRDDARSQIFAQWELIRWLLFGPSVGPISST